MKVLVLGGGDSPEREISLRSASAVVEALHAAGFETIEADPKNGLSILDGLTDTIVFPILHGAGGEDGVIQKQLEDRKLPYLGTMSDQSKICFDKVKARSVYKENDLPVAQGDVVTHETYWQHELRNVPHVLKVSRGGSSIGTYLVYDPNHIDQSKVDGVFELCPEAVLEELVEGVEITVPILDNQALSVFEVQPPKGEEFDYANKYNGATQELCPPVSVDGAIQKRAQDYAARAHRVLRCRHLSRTDIIVRPDSSMVLLETNTMPGMTDQSFFPKAADVAGMTFPELMKKFVQLVKRDYKLEG